MCADHAAMASHTCVPSHMQQAFLCSQDPDKFIEQADQEQSQLRQKLEDATERVKAVEASDAAFLT